jgi:ABC-type proline/glycine betaine transport system permease subunit
MNAHATVPRSEPHRLSWWYVLPLLALLLALLLGASACGGSSSGGVGLLSGRAPTNTNGVSDAGRINDGIVPPTGSAWSSNRTAVFSSRTAFVEYDLGRPVQVRSAALLGDNNDRYSVLGSLDGKEFRPVWEARPARGPGVQWRSQTNLGGPAVRYVRLGASQGDSGLSVAELVLSDESPSVWPPRLREQSALDGSLIYRNQLILLVAAFGALVLGSARSAPRPWNGLLLVLALLALGQFVLALGETHPLGALEVSLTRAVAAVLGLVVVLREAWGPVQRPSWAAVNVGTLVLAATLAVASFFNMGQPQFFDHKNQEPSIVHNYDMRVYFPVAKYFRELRYDGLYLASVATYAEEHGGLETAELRSTDIRDLRDHRMRPVSSLHAELAEVKSRFTPQRWDELKTDMRYFWETMGSRAYLGSMADHGGNATPVWLAIAHVLFAGSTASNSVLTKAALLDPLLLLVFAVAVWRTFGVRTALVALTVYGANDFYMFGSNWAGATLRNDWMIYLGLGVCALRAARYRTGGALLAMSALIRAFPALALFALAVPFAFGIWDEQRRSGRWPTPKEVLRDQKWFFDAALGAAVCVVVWLGLSSLVLGGSAWPLWVKKIASFTDSPHVNHISLLTVIAGSEGNQALVLRARLPVFWAMTALYVALAAWAAVRRPPYVAPLLGIALVPVFMYPANYYMHFVFLLPLLVDEPLRALTRTSRVQAGRVWALLLGMCAFLYLTVKEQSLDIHFYNASVLLMSTLLAISFCSLPRDDDGQIVLPTRSPAK